MSAEASSAPLAESLADFSGRHQGATFVVCGCGPSLNDLPIQPGCISIGVNDVGRRFDPDYLVVVNPPAQFPPHRRRAIEESRARAGFTQYPDWRLERARRVPIALGAYKGHSACYMAERIHELGLDVRFDVVGTFQGNEHTGASNCCPPSPKITRGPACSPTSPCIADSVVEAAEDLAEGSLDFVFIDATHTFEAVSQDIAVSWPKLKASGLMAANVPGVRDAVDGFVARHGLAAAFRTSRDSWMMDKDAP